MLVFKFIEPSHNDGISDAISPMIGLLATRRGTGYDRVARLCVSSHQGGNEKRIIKIKNDWWVRCGMTLAGREDFERWKFNLSFTSRPVSIIKSKSIRCKTWCLDLAEGSEKVAGIAGLIGVGDELGIEFLVSLNVNATGLLVFFLKAKK